MESVSLPPKHDANGGVWSPSTPDLDVSLSNFQQPHHRIGSRITLTMELRDNFSPVLPCISRGSSTQASILDIPQAVCCILLVDLHRACGACWTMEIVDEKASPLMVSCLIPKKCISRRSTSRLFVPPDHHLIFPPPHPVQNPTRHIYSLGPLSPSAP
jgi:hypothetical protein